LGAGTYPLDLDAPLLRSELDGRAVGKARGNDAGEARSRAHQPLIEAASPSLVVTLEARVHGGEQHRIGVESGIDLLRGSKAFHEDGSADEEDERERYLPRDQNRAQTSSRDQAARRAAGRDAESGNETEGDRGKDGDQGSEGEDSGVEPDVDVDRSAHRKGDRFHRAVESESESHPGDGGERREDERFREQLAQQARSPCAERHPDAHLSLPRLDPRHLEIRHVPASDEEDEAHDPHENKNGARHGPLCVGGQERLALRDQDHRAVPVFVGIGLAQLPGHERHMGLRLVEVHLRLQPSDDVEKAPAPVSETIGARNE